VVHIHALSFILKPWLARNSSLSSLQAHIAASYRESYARKQSLVRRYRAI
jgi:hypothetical protein